MHMLGEEQALADQEQHGHAQAAEDFEVDPEVLIGEGHVQVGCAAEDEKDDPGHIQLAPDRLRQAQGMAHDALNQRALTDELAAQKGQGKQPVDHRGFPFEEGLAVEGQGQAAEDQAGEEGQPLAFLQFALLEVKEAVDHQRTDDQHGGRTEDTADDDAVPQQFMGCRFDFVDDEKQQQRDEVDELFHNGSQKQDVAA